MAKSAARKQRERMIKQGKLDPAALRGNWNGVQPVTRMIPNKKKDLKAHDYDRAFSTLSVVS